MISYDDFAKLEIKIGTIVSVEIVPDADKLLKLSVEVGEMADDGITPRPRQIISGIRGFFGDPQDLVGKQCPFLTNLEPRVIRGFESDGMILAASNDNEFALLVPHVAIKPGTRIK
jgi:methionyl-tRNA synthetase